MARRKPLVVVLDLPDHDLTLNQARFNHAKRRRLVREHKEAAYRAGLATVPAHSRPWFPPTALVLATCRVERRPGGRRWDFGGMVEALKPALDALQGAVFENDQQVVGMVVLWDRKPTGTGRVVVTFTEWEEDDG